MKLDNRIPKPDHTAIRVALWRALHVQIDPPPHIFIDEIGAKLVEDKNWKNRPDMNPEFSKSMRASIVARARFVEDLVKEQMEKGITQYIILGAGLDTFAQRHPDLVSRLNIFEIDRPDAQAWKKKRLNELGYSTSSWPHFIPGDFENNQLWWEQLLVAGFNNKLPAIFVSTGVSMYLSKETNQSTLQQIAKMAKGSTFAMTFLLSLNLLSTEERSVMKFVMTKAEESETPFLSLFSPFEILEMSNVCGFKKSQHVSANELYQRYFTNRADGLNLGHAEGFLIATT